jgi:signal peptide peptidase SppA
MKYAHILGFALEHPWAITASMRVIIAGILAQRIAGETADAAELSALVNRKNLPQPVRGGVAVIPVYGVIAPRMNMLSEMSGGTTFEALTAQLHDALANDAVKTIIFDVDSPGGNVAGAREFAAEVLQARARKPIIAQAQHLMASAAYWPMACATSIVASPSSMVGAVGVYHIHDDISEALAKAGIKREVFSAGKFKAEGADGGALSDDAREYRQSLITAAYTNFVADVAKGRGVPATTIKNGYGEGRGVNAETALELGMIDKIGTLADTLARYGPLPARQPASSVGGTGQDLPLAAADTPQDRATDIHWQNAALGELLALDF